jgi:hypothetical protein
MSRNILLAVVAFAFSTPLLAHHGTGTFDLTTSVTFTATLTRVELVNPHSWLYFDVREPDGRISKHRCEMRSVHTLRRSGWSKELFPAGARVTIEAAPDRRDPASCYLNTIRFADGGHMDRYGQYVKGTGGLQEVRGELPKTAKPRAARRPTGEPNLTGEWAPEQVVMADPRGTGGGLVPLSTIAQSEAGQRGRGANAGRAGAGGRAGGGPRQYGGTELTALGEARAAAFTQEDNPRFRCETTSILFDWTFDGPVNRITQNKDSIVIEYGQRNLKRTVHMNRKAHPATVRPSRAGHSIGRWENDVLVVDTIGFLPGVLTGPIRHGARLHVVERFALDPKTMKITRTYTAEDPEYLKGTASNVDVVQVADAPYTKDECKEQGFIDYSKQVGK